MAPHTDYTEEIDRLVARAEKDPRTHTFARLADLYRKSGELDRALDVVENGLRHHPHYLNARLVHARVLRELGRSADARRAFERVLQVDSENLVARAALAELGDGGPVVGLPEPDPAPSAGWLARLDADWRRSNDADGASANGSGARERPQEAPRDAPPDPSPVEAEAQHEPEAEPPDAAPVDQGPMPPAEMMSESEPTSVAAEEPTEPPTDVEPDLDPAESAEPEAISDPEHPPEREPTPPVKPSASPPGAGSADPPEVETATLAALYVRQGLLDRAISIYERLLARDPYNARLAAALEEARQQAHGGEPSRSSEQPRAAIPSPALSEAAPTSDRREGDSSGTAADMPIHELLGLLLDGEAEVEERENGSRWPEWLRELGRGGD